MAIQILPLEKIRASTYNPRKSDPERLHMLNLSLRKLGFLTPIVADQAGEIISGHQRSFVASTMGAKKVPVIIIPKLPFEKRKALNLLFNRSTNDLTRKETSQSVKKYISQFDVESMAAELPDLDFDSEEFYPCCHQETVDCKDLFLKNIDKADEYCLGMAEKLEANGIRLPIIIDEEDRIVNGIGRVNLAYAEKRKLVDVVRIPNKRAELARLMLNYLTMDFHIQKRYADTLRYNSFMRPRNNRAGGLGDGFFKGLFPKKRCTDLMTLEGADLKQWTEHFGTSIIDFGAGKLSNTHVLREAGLQVSAFEPYFIAANSEISKTVSLEINRKFLAEIASGREYTAIFISSVFNSVPFMADRKHIARICAALASRNTVQVCWCQGVNSARNAEISRGSLGKGLRKSSSFIIDYEPNVSIGELNGQPKVQKYHSHEEIFDIFNEVYEKIYRLQTLSAFVYMEATHPRPVDMAKLKESIQFEFDLPYPDGTTMGLVDEALAAFEKRLGQKFP